MYYFVVNFLLFLK